MTTQQEKHDLDPGVPLASPVRRWLRHAWLVERHDYENGDVNITWGFAYIEATSFKVGVQWFYYDGLPVRRIALGWIAFGWGETHEWFCCDSA